jgi:Putative zinc- or iron-chelating domain
VEHRVAPAGEVPPLDLALLRGFAFTCRDDCGLCCYAEPRVRPQERGPLLQIAPETAWVHRADGEFLAARTDGGACQFLVDRRCTVHAVRPSPCREFPLTAHLGLRLQATMVLSCPGVDLTGLDGWRPGAPGPITGLDGELAALRARVDRTTARRMGEAARRRARIARRLERDGRWLEEDEVRSRLRRELPRPGAPEFPVGDPPSADDGLELLPLFFGGLRGPVALASGPGGWQLLELRADGGVERTIAIVPPPTTVPDTTSDGRATLDGYLRYWVERDELFGSVHAAMLESEEGSVEEWARAELRQIGAVVLARADVRARARLARPRPLTRDDVLDGIRATDQDLLDRETWGDRL